MASSETVPVKCPSTAEVATVAGTKLFSMTRNLSKDSAGRLWENFANESSRDKDHRTALSDIARNGSNKANGVTTAEWVQAYKSGDNHHESWRSCPAEVWPCKRAPRHRASPQVINAITRAKLLALANIMPAAVENKISKGQQSDWSSTLLCGV
jgi:hypothetical protein